MPAERANGDGLGMAQLRVIEDWGEGSLQSKICSAITRELTRNRRRFRLSELPELVGRQERDGEIDHAALYLASSRAGLLQLAFELYDEENESYSLSPATVIRAIRENVLEHPVTNEIVENFREKIVVYLEDRRA